jgi:hypothetical protein
MPIDEREERRKAVVAVVSSFADGTAEEGRCLGAQHKA